MRTIMRNLITVTTGLVAVCFLLSCGGRSDRSHLKFIFPATEVGVPQGDRIVGQIGPAGGMVASSDGRLTLTVPQGAVAESIAFSIQPVTNTSGNGIGSAYRLEPSGVNFAVPLRLTIKYSDHDLEGTVPEALALAYQDETGTWHEKTKIDETDNAFTIETTHFTDWSFLAKMRIEPRTATVGVGKSVFLVLIGCVQYGKAPSFLESVLGESWKVKHVGDPEKCQFGEVDAKIFEWFVDVGTIETGINPVKYTAPAKKPDPNFATVVFPYSLVDFHKCFGGDCHARSIKDGRRGVFTSRITIVDRGYRAKGQKGDVVFSGVICDLTKPFTINAGWLTDIPMKFDPAAGTWEFSTRYNVLAYAGSGTFTVEGADTENPRLAVFGSETITHPYGGKTTQGGDNSLELIPLTTDECK
jgi:hypothetical protein